MMEKSIAELLELNGKHSEMFIEQSGERTRYLTRHPTVLVAFKCMDGRIHLPTITRTPLGIIKPHRNIGGKFNLGWPLLSHSISDTVSTARIARKPVLVLVTYHYSRSVKSRGCAGFRHDKELALQETLKFKEQIERVYGRHDQVVVPILVGIETDTDALILHGEGGQVIDLYQVNGSCETIATEVIQRLYPYMPEQVRSDLKPLICGNLRHISENKGKKPVSDLEHGEWVLAVGKGFDWLHTPNMALIVGPYNPNIGEPILTAASIINDNFATGRVKRKGIVVLSSAISKGPDRDEARERAMYLGRLAKSIINDRFPDISGITHGVSVVVDRTTMKMEVVYMSERKSREPQEEVRIVAG